MSDREWAAEQAPRLVEEARAEALEEARGKLRRRLVDALLEAAAEPAPVARRSPARTGSGLWVYGVVGAEAGDRVRVAGVDGASVRPVAAGDLAALVSDVPLDRFGEEELTRSLEDIERLEALARAHQQVLDRALATGAVIPFRICTIYEDEHRVREMLERERQSLGAALERVAGAAEWGLKAYFLGVPAAEPAPAAQGAPSGTEWLERRRDDRAAEAAAQEEAEQRVAAVHARLGEHATASVVSRPHDRRLSGHEGEMLLNAAYLVPDDRVDGFGDVVGGLAREHEPHGLRLELTGPWAPYHFVGGADGR